MDSYASPYQLQYGGRLTDPTGAPLLGPISLSVSFFNSATDSTALQVQNFSHVLLKDGLFNVTITLSLTEMQSVFSSSDVWVEIRDTTHLKTFPRQRLTASPFAYRVPVDGINLGFDTNGQLTVKGLAGGALPMTTPTAGQVLKWKTGGGWEWGTSDGGASSGLVDSSMITDGTIKNEDIAIDAAIAQSKVAGLPNDLATITTSVAGKENTIAVGTSTQYWRGDKSWASLDTSAVPESANLYYTAARARAAISSSAPLIYDSASGQISLPQASSASSGYLSSNDWLSFNNKQQALPAGTSTDYLRGDKSWAPLSTSVVSEGSNFYYTEARARAAFSVLGPLTYNSSTGAYSLGVASSVSNGYLSSSDWMSFSNKQSAIGSGTSLPLGKISTSLQDAVTINPYAAASGQTGELRFSELAANGSNYIGLKAPDQIGGNLVWTLPATDGTNGQSLTTDGVGNLVWTTLNAGSGGGVVSITAGTGLTGGSITSAGTIGLANTSVMPGAYNRANITVDAQGRLTSAISSAAIVDADISNTAAIAQNKIQNLSSDLSAINSTLSEKEAAISAGTTAQYYRGDKSWQTLNTTSVPEGSNLYYTDARAALSAKGALSGSAPISFSNMSGAISMSQSSNAADGYLRSSDWAMFNGKQAPITTSTELATGTVTSAFQNGHEFKPFGTTAGQTGEIRFDELAANGANFIGFKAPDTLAADKIWTLPATDGTNGQVLSTNGSGALSWMSTTTGTVTNVTGTAPISVATGTTTPSISISQSNGTTNGYLSSTDWTTFSNKQASLSAATSVASGYLSSLDWLTFNSKQAAGSYITALTGDVTASGPGSATATLASIVTAGTSTKVTYDAKGRITAGASLAAADIPSLDASKITSGSLGVANGGTGATTLAANSVLLGNGTSALQAVAPGASGNFLMSNGTTWTSAASSTNWAAPGAIGSTTPNTGAFTSLTTTGNVGIGTTSPGGSLHVAPPIGSAAWSYFQSNTGTAPSTSIWGLAIGANRSSGSSEINFVNNTSPGDGFYFDQSNGGGNYTRLVTIKGSGNVGIGTTAPSSLLHAAATVANGGLEAKIENLSATVASAGLRLKNTVRNWALFVRGDASNILAIQDDTAGAIRMAIDANGNVGIGGSTAPTQKLTIAGNGDVIGLDNAASMTAKNAANGYETFLWPRWSDNIMYMNYGTSGFNIRNNANASTMFLTNDNNVGIGYAAPSYKLDVNGDIRSNGWLRSQGSAGWYSETYGGGWYMTDTTWLRAYNSKNIYTAGRLQADAGLSTSGQLVVTTAVASDFAAKVFNSGNGANSHGLGVQGGAQSGGYLQIFYRGGDGGWVGSITHNGSTAAYNGNSDRRLKENIVDASDGLNLLNKIQVRNFNYITDPSKRTLEGFIAQELNEVYPQAVTIGGDDPKVKPWQVDYSQLTPLLVKSMQQMQRESDAKDLEIAKLKARADQLKSEADELKAFLCKQFPEAPMCHP